MDAMRERERKYEKQPLYHVAGLPCEGCGKQDCQRVFNEGKSHSCKCDCGHEINFIPNKNELILTDKPIIQRGVHVYTTIDNKLPDYLLTPKNQDK